jgi:cytochrome c
MVSALIVRTAVAVAGLAAAPAMADATAGQKAFQGQCSTCHAVTPGTNKIGPSLYEVVGRPAATVAGYTYSAAMKKSGLTWSAAELDTYLTAPSATVHGTKMTFAGVKDATKRADIVAYLATLK